MLQRLGFPDVGRHRRFVSALGIDALGGGIWMPLSMLYFLRQTDLTLVELGLVMTIANLAVTPLVPYVGRLVDRVGPKSVMQGGNLIQAASFAAYPFVDSMLTVGIALGVSTVGRTMFWGSNGPLITQITQPGEREQWFGFVQAMRNAGMGVGGLLAGLALSIGTDAAYEAVVIANAASFVVAFVLMTGVTAGGRPEIAPGPTAGRGLVLRDRGYRWLVLAVFGYALTEMTLNVAMPVYFADLLGLPAWVPGAVFVINTVMIGLGQGLVVRSLTGVDPGPRRAARHLLHRLLVRADVRRGRGVGGPRHRRGARRRGDLHDRRADGRAGAGSAVRRGGAGRAPRPLHVRGAARLEHLRGGRPAPLRGPARPRFAGHLGWRDRALRACGQRSRCGWPHCCREPASRSPTRSRRRSRRRPKWLRRPEPRHRGSTLARLGR